MLIDGCDRVEHMEHVSHSSSGSRRPEMSTDECKGAGSNAGWLNAAKEFELTPFSLRCIADHVRFEAHVAIFES